MSMSGCAHELPRCTRGPRHESKSPPLPRASKMLSGLAHAPARREPEIIATAASDARLEKETTTAAARDERGTKAASRVRAAIGAVPAITHGVGGALERADGADEA